MPGNDEYNVIALQEREGQAVKPEITLIKKSSPNPIMSKRIFLDEQGKVCSDVPRHRKCCRGSVAATLPMPRREGKVR
jgi:hypothetical protein